MLTITLRDDGFGIPSGSLPKYIVGIRIRDQVLLHPVEVAYLSLTNEAKVIKDGKELSFKDVLAHITSALEKSCKEKGKGCRTLRTFWSLLTVYYDLRKKNRKVVPEARREGTLVEIRRNSWWSEYLVLEEGLKVKVEDLLYWADDVRANDMKSIVAVVDRNSGVTYYELTPVEFREVSKRTEEVPSSQVFS